MLVPKYIGVLRFILHFSFLIAISPLRNCFYLLKIILNDEFKDCFQVVSIFTLTLFIGFSIDLLNIALFLNLVFYFLILLPSFSLSICKSVLHSTNIQKNLWILF